MTRTSGLSASVDRINCEKGTKSSTTRTPMDDMSAGCSLNANPTTGSSTRVQPEQQLATHRHIVIQTRIEPENLHFRQLTKRRVRSLSFEQSRENARKVALAR